MNNKKVSILLLVISAMFLALIVHITVFDLIHHDEYATTNTSGREEFVRRGSIYDRNGVLLAKSTGNIKNQQRVYPYKNLYSHIIGYKSSIYDTSELEKAYNAPLMGEDDTAIVGEFMSFIEDARYALSGKSEKAGADMTLTIDHTLQSVCHSALGNFKGSVVVMNPKTGEIYAMVSKPDFDPTPETLDSAITNASNNSLMRRATNELYMPGSTFKIVVTAAMLDNNMQDYVVNSETELRTDVTNYGNKKEIEGEVDLAQAFKTSSNIYFAEAAIELGKDKILEKAKNFYFSEKISLKGLGVNVGTLPESNSLNSYRAVSNMALGQENVTTTPLHLAMIASTIANDGVMMQPYIVSKLTKPSFYRADSKSLKRCISSSTAKEIKDLMRLCVAEGTGTAANVYGRNICGKTGTAEVDTAKGTAHAHFIGFAPYENPEVAIAVVLENVDDHVTGGGYAAPIARTVLDKYFQLNP